MRTRTKSGHLQERHGGAPGFRADALLAALVGAGLAVAFARLLGIGWPPAALFGLVLAAGSYLWAADDTKRWSDLGQGILLSGVVALALLAIQRESEERFRDLDERREQTRNNQSLRVALGLQHDLSQIDLRGRDLRGFVLTEKRLVGATLDDAQLQKAVLARANLQEASAIRTVMDGAVLTGADLRRAVFVGSRPSPGPSQGNLPAHQASFQRAILDRVDMRGLDLQGLDFGAASLNEARLARAQLSAADLRRASLQAADLGDASLEHVDLLGADLRHARLARVASERPTSATLSTTARRVGPRDSIR